MNETWKWVLLWYLLNGIALDIYIAVTFKKLNRPYSLASLFTSLILWPRVYFVATRNTIRHYRKVLEFRRRYKKLVADMYYHRNMPPELATEHDISYVIFINAQLKNLHDEIDEYVSKTKDTKFL